MRQVECSACGAQAKVIRGDYRFSESGLRKVVLQGIELAKCPKCRNIDAIIPRVNDLMRLLAVAVVAQPFRLQGDDVRFLRKYLNMAGAEFASLIHVDKSTLSKWENNSDPVGEQSDRLIRAVTLALGEGLKEKIEEVVRSFPTIHDFQRSQGRIDVDPSTQSYQYA